MFCAFDTALATLSADRVSKHLPELFLPALSASSYEGPQLTRIDCSYIVRYDCKAYAWCAEEEEEEKECDCDTGRHCEPDECERALLIGCWCHVHQHLVMTCCIGEQILHNCSAQSALQDTGTLRPCTAFMLKELQRHVTGVSRVPAVHSSAGKMSRALCSVPALGCCRVMQLSSFCCCLPRVRANSVHALGAQQFVGLHKVVPHRCSPAYPKFVIL